MGRLEGRVAIVTGAGGGIGREHALLLAAEGARVVVNDIGVRAGADAGSVVEAIRDAGGTAIASTTSATWDGAEAIVAEALDAFGRLDILVNNATVFGVEDLWRVSEQEWDRTLGVNLKGAFAMIRAAAPHLCRQGSGVIVNTSSESGAGHPGMVTYAVAKEGVIGLTGTVARELGRFGVRCNAIRPTAVGLAMREFEAMRGDRVRVMNITLGLTPGVEEVPKLDPERFATWKVAPFVVWLCTDAAADVNGHTFLVRGDEVALVGPAPTTAIRQRGGWDLDGLDAGAPALTGDLTNLYRLEGFPELQVFED
jgi:NAD(P)-dependent dehydrogenase (short-subunit alcohol dehydrogenase family)